MQETIHYIRLENESTVTSILVSSTRGTVVSDSIWIAEQKTQVANS